METLSKAAARDASREKELSAAASDSPSLPSFKDYPAHRPFTNTTLPHTPLTTMRHAHWPSPPCKAFPETRSAVILSALKNLQEKLRKLELEKEHAELSLLIMGKDPHANTQRRLSHTQTHTRGERSESNSYNQVLVTHLSDAESRCVKLESQLENMKKTLRHSKDDSRNLKQQVTHLTEPGGRNLSGACDWTHRVLRFQGLKSPDDELEDVSDLSQSEKLERLEQEYLRLMRSQKNAEVKIHELEIKLQEEEHQRKLVQNKADQMLMGLEANKILLPGVSSRLSRKSSRGKRSSSKKSVPQPSSCTEPHYRLSLRDVPFVAGTSAGCSHSVRANVQSVLSLLKQHQPQLCNKRVLSRQQSRMEAATDSDSSSSLSSGRGGELCELLQTLQEELHLMSLEQDMLMREVEASVSQEERNNLHRAQERLLLKMERKGEQINKLHKHKTQIKKKRKEFYARRGGRTEAKAPAAAPTRGRSARAVKPKPGERNKTSLKLLRDMQALQTSLHT
ncbi:centrosomal protein of 57 kDa isoform X1 [Genypterus blacodes]|uniref:centrosomal protein of 57 kDa isoform X1 n=1 Tax=Genypterus blacodes TaxID=154954 RepID=UPI003F76C349